MKETKNNIVSDLIKTINSLSGKYSPYMIFSDWVEMGALSVCNSFSLIEDSIWKDREQQYLAVAAKYSKKELDAFCDMLGMLAFALEEDLSDVLGEIFMRARLGSGITGQFFTPFHLSELTAKLALRIEDINRNGTEPIELVEPSCGGGGMVIAAAKVLADEGIDWQRRLRVTAQDLDSRGVYMTYLQISLIGVRGIVVQGDTLREPYVPGKTPREKIYVTPAEMIGGLP